MAINRAAHDMGIGTIAEFVENDQTLAKLRELQVDLAQGFVHLASSSARRADAIQAAARFLAHTAWTDLPSGH
jgi:EAL domain-containing protein (putative c-di-GMP-specific phosphodiesterase class I)